MSHKHTPARRARARRHADAAHTAVFAAALTVALATALLLAPAGGARADDDVERAVALMAKVGAANTPSFSPDGSRIAFVTNISGLPQVWTMPAAGGYPEIGRA